MAAKELTAGVVNRLGVTGVYASLKRRILKSEVAVLLYHRVSPREDVCWSLEIIGPESFEDQVEYLCDNYEVLSLEALVQCLRGKEPLPRKAAVITFDDGYRDNYLYAYPTLKKYRVPATVFLTTGHIGTADLFWWDKVAYVVEQTSTDRLQLDEVGSYYLGSSDDRSRIGSKIVARLKSLPEQRKRAIIEMLVDASEVSIPQDLGKQLILSWEEVREMNRNGIDFGAHSVTHPILTKVSVEEARSEISRSREDIERQLGEPVKFFAYPDGRFDAQIVDMVKQSGFLGAVAVEPKRWVTRNTDPYEINRILVATENWNIIRGLLCGLWGDVESILR